MSGFTVTIDDREVLAAFARLIAQAQATKPAMSAIGQTLVTDVDLAFRGQRDPWGAAWRPLSGATRKRRRGSSARILRDTGRLAGSFFYKSDNASVTVGTNVVYAATHQFGADRGAFGRTRRGSPIPWGNIPARPMLPIRGGAVDLPPETSETILDVIRAHLGEAFE